MMILLIIILIAISGFTSSVLSLPMKVAASSQPFLTLGQLAGAPPPASHQHHLDDLIDPTLSCSSDWQCPYRWYCLEATCTKETQLDEDRLAGSAFALAIQSLLVFGSLTLFLCSPCLSLIFFGYYLGYCPTGAVDRSGKLVAKGGKGGNGRLDKEEEKVAQEMMVVRKRRQGETVLVRSGKSKKTLKLSEAQAQVLCECLVVCLLSSSFILTSSNVAQVNQLTPPLKTIEPATVDLEQKASQMAEDKFPSSSLKQQIEPASTGKLAEKAADNDDDIAAAAAAAPMLE